MIRRGIAVTEGVAEAVGTAVGVRVGVAGGAGMSPGAGAVGDEAAAAVAVARRAVDVAPATAVLVGAAVGLLVAVGTGWAAVGLVVPAVVDVAATGALEAGSPPELRMASASAVESCSAASRARRDSSARDTPNHDPASTASEVAATNRLTSVRRTNAPCAASAATGARICPQSAAKASACSIGLNLRTIPSRPSFGMR